ncbi:MAG TPA: class I SAM-dependent rRNA methyltransferase [Saprospiraceae bacterium]|nr:class I SAM-dependent rRNA methyltransferase [Saprospiraceae bacterium]
MTEVFLKKNKSRIMDVRHPWIFSGALQTSREDIEAGELVRVSDSQGQFKAIGHWGSGSIAVRILSWEDRPIDRVFWEEKLHAAIELRLQLGLYKPGENDCFRLVHGEGDGLPGLIVDYYAGVVVLQCHSKGMLKESQSLSAAFLNNTLLDIHSVYLRAEGPAAAGGINRFLSGEHAELTVLENGLKYHVDVVEGQKTGFFLDQRDNRMLLRRLSKGKKVLNCFCYTGGFSISALEGEATSVESVDVSKTALQVLEKNLALNHFTGDRHETLRGDALKYLNELEASSYDVVILDPPAFAKSRKKRHNAVQAYKRLNAAGMKVLRPGGLLMTYSCSQVVDEKLFTNTVVAAGLEAGGDYRILKKLQQGMDHPVHLFHPEGRYLKGLLLRKGT